MKALKEFDYDLWTTGDASEKRYWTRIKATGETCEVDHEVMKLLRNEEKTMRREIGAACKRNSGPDLSYDDVPVEDAPSAWLLDPIDYEQLVLQRDELDRFRLLLTPAQRSVFDECLCGGKSLTEYAAEHGVSIPLVSKRIGFIRKKATDFLSKI